LIYTAGWIGVDMLSLPAQTEARHRRVVHERGPRAASFTRFPDLPAEAPEEERTEGRGRGLAVTPAGHYHSSPLPLVVCDPTPSIVSCYSSSDLSDLRCEEEEEPEPDPVEAARRMIDVMRKESADVDTCAKKIVEYIYRAMGNCSPVFRLTDDDGRSIYDTEEEEEEGARENASSAPPIAAFQRMGFVSYEHDDVLCAVVPVVSVTESEMRSLFARDDDDEDRSEGAPLRLKDHAINAIMDVGQRRSLMINPVYRNGVVPDCVVRPAGERAFYFSVVCQTTPLTRLLPPRAGMAYVVLAPSAPHVVTYTRRESRWERHPPHRPPLD
jgi:hypothetical protein